jgi:hypothetical protein
MVLNEGSIALRVNRRRVPGSSHGPALSLAIVSAALLLSVVTPMEAVSAGLALAALVPRAHIRALWAAGVATGVG